MRAMQSNRESDSLSEYGLRAIERLHECETDLDDARMTALRDLFTLDESAASVYAVIKKESLRKCWIRKRLQEMSFPGESRLADSSSYVRRF
jgi:hypothetical protein